MATLPTTPIDLLSVVAGIQVSDSDILQSELLLSQVLKVSDPTLDTQIGTAVRDLAIRPNATLLATINKALTYFWAQNSLSVVDDVTPAVFVDKMLKNFFMTRRQGAKTVITARLYFTKQVDVVLSGSTYFSVDNIRRFFPVVPTVYNKSQLLLDTNINQFYLVIDLEAENIGTPYNISSGSLVYYSTFNPFFVHAEISYLKSSALDSETNTAFIARASADISTRNLINSPSIRSRLLEAFPSITNILSVGMGDLEMIRDKQLAIIPFTGEPLWAHMGGCVDVYAKSPISKGSQVFTTDSAGMLELTGPIIKLSISTSSTTTQIAPTTPFTYKSSYMRANTPIALTSVGTLATLKLYGHGLEIGERFVIKGCNQAAFNGVFSVNNVMDATTLTFNLVYTPNESTATGPIIVNTSSRSNELGFSSRQAMLLSFNSPAKSIPQGAYWQGGVVIITLPSHGVTTGDLVNVTGLSPYPDADWVATRIDADRFSFATIDQGVPTYTSAAFHINRGGKTVTLDLSYLPLVDSIQAYLDDPTNRVVGANLLARGYNVTFLDIAVVGHGSSSPNQTIAVGAVTTYLNSLVPGQTLIMADLMYALSSAGITGIRTPISASFTKCWRDLLDNTYGTVSDTLDPKDRTNIFVLNTLTTSAVA